MFFERGPRQRNIYHCESRLKHPSELKGKKFGCFRYGATAVVWARGYLLDAHDIKTTDMQWFVSGREVFIGHELPVKVQRIEPLPPFGGEKLVLSKMLSEGELQGAEPDTLDVLASAVTADTLARQRALVLQRLRQLGIDVIEAPWEAIGYRLIDRYLEIKRKGAIG